MPANIPSMQSGDKQNLKEFLQKDGEAPAKRTTIILEKEEREYIDALIRDGKEPGIKPLISKMLDVYRSMMVYDWRFPGEYYCGISRIAFVNVELLNILIQQTPKEKWREIGIKMGSALKVSMETTLDLPAITRSNWDKIFKRLRVQGLGDIATKDKYLLVKTPFINEPEILGGILEGLLDVELDLKNTVPPLVFEVRKTLASDAPT
ncbi:MAG: hypothetical protein NWF05_10120 [Candidatus Bathyarchaeota archaeon]|nr:hypothetical protein [Candidatus Bathyarchaeota archaeon]